MCITGLTEPAKSRHVWAKLGKMGKISIEVTFESLKQEHDTKEVKLLHANRAFLRRN